jgi:hypothetical protein
MGAGRGKMRRTQQQTKGIKEILKLRGKAKLIGTDLIIEQGKNGKLIKRSLFTEAKNCGLVGKTVRYKKKSDAGGMSIAGRLYQNENGQVCVGAHVLEHYLSNDFAGRYELKIDISEEIGVVSKSTGSANAS